MIFGLPSNPTPTGCSLPKVFDSIMTDKLSVFIGPLITTFQHGFLPAKSTESNLLLFTDYVAKAFIEHEQVDAFFSDFSKAFDSVNHELLIRKLYNNGIRDNVLKWIGSYLTGRSAQVKIKNFKSEQFDILSGVSQSSHLGPLLF